LVDHQVTAWSTTPSLLAAVLDAGTGSVPWPVRTLVLDGEPIPEPLLGRVAEHAPQAVVVGMYGTAEAGARVLVAGDSAGGGVAGRSLPGGRAYIVDARFELCPVGVPGEIVLGGTGVGAGYLDQPGATAARFVPDRFSGVPGARLVRTGDAGVLRPDGTLGVLGRMGDRVDRSGAWRPPGAVTAALYAQPGVRMAAVVTRADLPDAPLVAHVVGGRADRVTAALAGRLPAHLVPSEVVAVRALAFTAAGRVDWSAHVMPDAEAPEHVPPSNAVEQDLADVCAELLRVERVGMADNVFRLGGNSLLMARLSGRITALHGVEIPLRRLFTAKTVREIANMIINAQLADVDEAEYAALMSDLDSGKDVL
jgi:acyl-CoA synthetase (AMP-forming)/AMP-acid ligase II/acyl carrier protein